MGYMRFDKASEAIRYAIEELSQEHLTGAHLEVEDERYDCHGIRRLYDDAGYPLVRRAAPADR